jgi:hypothetical protein
MSSPQMITMFGFCAEPPFFFAVAMTASSN